MSRKACQPETAPALTVKFQCRFQKQNRKQKAPSPSESKTTPPTQIPRITKLLAQAHYYQKQLDEDVFRNYAEIAQSAGVSRARITQIMSLALLAPDIQREIILMNHDHFSRNNFTEHSLRDILKNPLWQEQKRIWNQ